jgi:hypothetical protein
MVGANSPFWNKMVSLFHCADGCNPSTDGANFQDKVHFEHTYNSQHHKTIDPSKHWYFSNDKLQSMWSILKFDYDQATVNFTKSSNHSSSFTTAAISGMRQI